MKKREFVLIKSYPDCGLKVGEIITFREDQITTGSAIPDHPLNSLTHQVQSVYTLEEIEKYPEFWREVYPIRQADYGSL